MRTYTHTLTDLEAACGVILEQVADALPRGLFIDGDDGFVLPTGLSPALAGSVARCAFGGPARFAGMNPFSHPIYRRAH